LEFTGIHIDINALIHFSLHNKLTWIVMLHKLKLITVLSLSISASVYAGILTLSSHNITQGEFMAKIQEFKGFGCSGGDVSPHLKFTNAPQCKKVLLLQLMTQMLLLEVVGGIGKS
jgi:Uri superfamily endonuclease